MKIVFITELDPFPPMGGETIRTFNLLKTLSSFASLYLIILGRENKSSNQYISDSSIDFPLEIIYITKNKPAGAGLWERLLPRKYIIDKLKEAVLKLKLKCDRDIIWLDYGYLAHYKKAFSNFKVIYGTHNVQSEIDRQLANIPNISPIRKIYSLLLWKASQYHEKKYLCRCDILIPVSSEDLKYYGQFMSSKKIVMVSNFVDLSQYPEPQLAPYERSKRIVFTGSMNAFQNERAGDYLLNKVWPIIANKIPECELFIVGKHPPSRWQEIADEKITITGKVDSTIDYIKTAQIAIVPVLDGSGTRYKILEAMACSTPVVSTSLGCQGLDVQNNVDILIAESAEELAQRTIELLNTTKKQVSIATKGYQLVSKKYSLKANKNLLKNLCHNLLNDRA